MSYSSISISNAKQYTKREDLNAKFKTEICRNWSLGLCPFAEKCFFAHGYEEIRNKHKFSSYKTKDCKQFHEIGYCQYGSRCQFKHRDTSVDTASNSPETTRQVPKENFKKRLPVFARLAPTN